MPPVPLDARAALLLHTLVPVTPSQLSALQPEDYLLIRRITVRATRQTERKINNEGLCYSRIDFDPVLSYDVDALALSPFGLANWHPGANMTTSELTALPVLDFANGTAHFGFNMANGKNIYEVPVLTEEPGTFPTIAFTVTREFSDVVATALPLPSPATVTTVSYPDTPAPSGVDYATLYGKSLIWYRLLDITGPGGHVLASALKQWLSLDVSAGGVPANYAAFRATVDTLPEVTGENVIMEVFKTTVPDGVYLKDDPLHLIRSRLEFGSYSFPPLTINFLIQYEDGGGGFAGSLDKPQTDPPLTTAAEVEAAYPTPPGLSITAIYAIDQAAWLTV